MRTNTGMIRSHRLDRFDAGSRFTGHLDVILVVQDHTEAVPDQSLIVDNNHADLCPRGGTTVFHHVGQRLLDYAVRGEIHLRWDVTGVSIA